MGALTGVTLSLGVPPPRRAVRGPRGHDGCWAPPATGDGQTHPRGSPTGAGSRLCRHAWPPPRPGWPGGVMAEGGGEGWEGCGCTEVE